MGTEFETVIHRPFSRFVCKKKIDFGCNISLATSAKHIAERLSNLPEKNNCTDDLRAYLQGELGYLIKRMQAKGLPTIYIENIIKGS